MKPQQDSASGDTDVAHLAEHLAADIAWLRDEYGLHIASMLGAERELRRQHAEIERLNDALSAANDSFAAEHDLREALHAELMTAVEARKTAQLQVADLQAEVARLEPMRQRAADIERLTAERDALRLADAAHRAAFGAICRALKPASPDRSTWPGEIERLVTERCALRTQSDMYFRCAQAVQPLTDGQIVGLAVGAGVDPEDDDDDGAMVFAIARAIERAHGIGQPASYGKSCRCGPDGCADSSCPGRSA